MAFDIKERVKRKEKERERERERERGKEVINFQMRKKRRTANQSG